MKKRLRLLRKPLNLTQKDFTQSIGLKSASAIGNIELGFIELSDRNIRSICEEFNVNEEWLREGKGDSLFYIWKNNILFTYKLFKRYN